MMISSLRKSREIIIDSIKPIKRLEIIPIDESLNRVISKPIISDSENPKWDVSRFDGYALRATDLDENNRLRVVNKRRLEDKECSRVETGKRIPENADYVVMVEDVKKDDDYITIEKKPDSKNILRKGSNIRKKEKLLDSGTVIDEVNVGIPPTIGEETVEVYEKAKVGIVVTGDEITPSNDVNSRVLKSLVIKNGGEVIQLERVGDVENRIKNIISDMLDSNLDLILTVGGTSKGTKDFVVQVVSNLGEILFDGVKMRPGKTFSFGKSGDIPIFSLSGTGSPCLIQAYLFLVPALKHINHLPKEKTRKLRLNKTISADNHGILEKGSNKVLPAKKVGENKIKPIFGKYTTILPFLSSNHLMILDEKKRHFEEGETVEAIPLD